MSAVPNKLSSGAESSVASYGGRARTPEELILLARASFVHRIEADELNLRSLYERRKGQVSNRDDEPLIGRMADCAIAIEEVAGCLDLIKRLTSDARGECRREIAHLPHHSQLCAEFEAKCPPRQRSAVLAPLLARVGAAPVEFDTPITEIPAGSQGNSQMRMVTDSRSAGDWNGTCNYIINSERLQAMSPRRRAGDKSAPRSGRHMYASQTYLETQNAFTMNTVDLFANLNYRMAVRVQRAWRCYCLRRTGRFRRGLNMLIGVQQRRHLRILQAVVTALRTHTHNVAIHAATMINRFLRGWKARCFMAKLASLRIAMSRRQWAKVDWLMRLMWRTWWKHATAAQGWKYYSLASWQYAPPYQTFWKLFPLEGKTAVGQAQHNWALSRRALTGWVQLMRLKYTL